MIEIIDLHKTFRVYRGRKAKLRAVLGLARSEIDYQYVHSLAGINLEVGNGRVHGIVGMNGAGKSTLLKILAGVLEPTSGQVRLEGRVAALLELGTGFHPDMTGRQNIETNAALFGFSPTAIKAKMAEIEDFAELGDFFDRPVKIYSSGMYVRLAFSFAIAVEPQVLIIDEALSVGDAYFQQKCLQEIYRFKSQQTTILFVSHDLGAVKILCDEVSLLADGQLIYSGAPLEALERYNALLALHKQPHRQELLDLEHRQTDPQSAGFQSGNQDIAITKVALYDCHGHEAEVFESGQAMKIEISAVVNSREVSDPTCGILLRDRLGYDVFGTNSGHMAMTTGVFRQGECPRFSFAMDLHLGPGDYTLTVALHSATTHVQNCYDWRDRAALFKVVAGTGFVSVGVARLYPKVEVHCSTSN